MSEWKKIEKSETHNFEISKEIVGIYLAKEENVGSNNSNLYKLEVGEDVVGVWGSTVLDNKMNLAKPGDEVKIVYLGKAKNPKTGREYKNYEVYARQPETDKNDKGYLDLSDLPF
jgi:hypothetical protein